MPTPWTSVQTRSQFAAIAWLRWRILLNGLRRKGGGGELAARIVIFPILGLVALLPIGGAGFFAWFFARSHKLDQIFWLLWVTFGICQLLNIQLGQPGTTFDPTQLIRFPMRLRSYTAVRLFFGLLSPANVIGTLMSLAIAIGITIARPSLWLYSLIALAIFAAANVLFSRMIFAWVDRWLSTRRAREAFTAIIFVGSLGIQWANFTFNPAYNRHGHHSSISPERLAFGKHLLDVARPALAALPPGLTGNSLVAAGALNFTGFLFQTLGCALYAAAFLAMFMVRMRTEYRGENLSDVANAVPKPKKSIPSTTTRSTPQRANTIVPATSPATKSSIVPTMLTKEFLYIRRNTGIFYALIAPIVFVFLFAGRLATHGNAAWVFPIAVAYSMLGITPLAYNSFGLEASGSQFYFLAPIRLRQVFLAKNLVNFILAFIEIAAVFFIIDHVAAALPSTQVVATTLLWAAATLLISTIVGNRRSIASPKKINISRSTGKQASPLSAFIGMGILLLSALLGGGLLLLATFFHHLQLLVPLFIVFAAVALWLYHRSLSTLDTFALAHREELFLELCKKD